MSNDKSRPPSSANPTIPVSASVSKYSVCASRTKPGSVPWRAHQNSNVPGPMPFHGAVSLACSADCQNS